MPVAKPISLGAFLSNQHHLQPRFLSAIDRDCDDWCLVNDPANDKAVAHQLSQRVNALENVSRQLLSRIQQLESKPSNYPAAIQSIARELPSSQKKAIEYHCSDEGVQKRKFRSAFAKLNDAKSLKDALVLQKQKILSKSRNKPRPKTLNKIILKSPKSMFQKELALRVRNPKLKETWHILKVRKVEDPHAASLMRLRDEMMLAKSRLKRVRAPDCKTVIILD